MTHTSVRTGVVVATILCLFAVGMPWALGQRVGNPSGPFTLTVHSGTIQIRDNTFNFSDNRQPQCSDGSNNDEDILGGSPQDSNVDFSGGDPQCTSALDDSEVQGGFQPLTPIRLVGTIAGDGTWNVPTTGVQVPQQWLFARPPIIGGTVITVTTSATHAATGNLNPLTGLATLRLRLRVDLDGTGLGSNCHIGDSGNPIDINTLGTNNSPGGAPYNPDTGALSMANHTFAVPGASGCSTFPVNVNNEINDALGLPSPSGQNHAIFSGDFPSNAKPTRAITANLTVTSTVACRPVTFNAGGSTSVMPVASYSFDDTNDGTFDQTGLSTTRTVTFNTAGTRTARLRVTDAQGDFHETLRTYTVGTNLGPSATDQNKPRSGSGDPVNVTLTGGDPEGGPLTFAVVTNPANGTLTGTPPDLTYTPDAGFGGSDGFTFSVTDDCGNTDTGTVSFSVNRVPTATSQTVSAEQDTPVNITLTGADGDGDALSFSVATNPANGTLTGTPPDLTYTPNAGFSGTDSFTFTVSDDFDTSAPGTVTINVAPNNPPTANPQSVTTNEDVAVNVVLSATDPDGDPITYTVEVLPAHGTLSGVAPNLVYTPAANYHGPDSFVFKAADDRGGSDTATVSITVISVNDPPVADPQSVTVTEETPEAITLTGSDVDGDALTFTVTSLPSNGTLSGTAPNLVYTPNANYIGPDSFTFTVNDGQGGTDSATITIDVQRAPELATTLVANPAIAWVMPGLTVYFPQLSATLTLASTGAPVAGAEIVFSVGMQVVCTAITDANGYAACGGVAEGAAAVLNLGYTASFAGDAQRLPTSDNGPLLQVGGIRLP